ncbi:hypothetical protein GYMLUDRAFT_959201 [Collybiopsis luxurians FD-317 M1]|nr:hypothetical protein GYMLUDRAFT_959201 [Collybiopsis luxurians FD-317 M1]
MATKTPSASEDSGLRFRPPVKMEGSFGNRTQLVDQRYKSAKPDSLALATFLSSPVEESRNLGVTMQSFTSPGAYFVLGLVSELSSIARAVLY